VALLARQPVYQAAVRGFLGAPLGEKSQQQKSQQLLHTSYHHRPEYKR
jgi:hypothetical protein